MAPPTLKGGPVRRPQTQPQASRPLPQNSILLPSELRPQTAGRSSISSDGQTSSGSNNSGNSGTLNRSLNSALVAQELMEKELKGEASSQEKLDLAYSIYLGACTANLITRELEALQDQYSAEELEKFLGGTELAGICHNVTTAQLPLIEVNQKMEKMLQVALFLKPLYVQMAKVFRSKTFPSLEMFKTTLEKEFGSLLLVDGDNEITKSPVFQNEEEMEQVVKYLEEQFLQEVQKQDSKASFKNVAKFSQVFVETLEKMRVMRKLARESSVSSENMFLELASQLATSKAVERLEKKRNKKKKRKAQSNNQTESGVDCKEEVEK